MRRGVGALALIVGLWSAAGAAGVPGDAGEATAQQAAALLAQRYAGGVGWMGGVWRCQWRDCSTEWYDVLGEKPPRLVGVSARAVRGRWLVQVETRAWDPWDTRGEAGPLRVLFYPTPASGARLTIQKVVGDTVHLRADSRERLLFDLGSRTYMRHPAGRLQCGRCSARS